MPQKLQHIGRAFGQRARSPSDILIDRNAELFERLSEEGIDIVYGKRAKLDLVRSVKKRENAIVQNRGNRCRKPRHNKHDIAPLSNKLLVGGHELSHVGIVCLYLVNEDEHAFLRSVDSFAEMGELVLEALICKNIRPESGYYRQPYSDITQARMRYGWEPTVSLRQGLERTIAYFDGLLRSGVLKGAA